MSWVLQAAQRLDEMPFMPAKVADRALGRFHAHRRRRAACDPTWAAIEERRKTDGATVKFLSADLTIADWETQRKIAQRITPTPAWVRLASRARHWGVMRVYCKISYVAQRTRRGWADSDVWELGRHTTGTLAAQLEHMAAHSHGWPSSEEFPTFEDWVEALRSTAAGLRRYYDDPQRQDAVSAWYRAASDPDTCESDRERLRMEMDEAEFARIRAAKDAMHWVAEHLDALWD